MRQQHQVVLGIWGSERIALGDEFQAGSYVEATGHAAFLSSLICEAITWTLCRQRFFERRCAMGCDSIGKHVLLAQEPLSVIAGEPPDVAPSERTLEGRDDLRGGEWHVLARG